MKKKTIEDTIEQAKKAANDFYYPNMRKEHLVMLVAALVRHAYASGQHFELLEHS